MPRTRQSPVSATPGLCPAPRTPGTPSGGGHIQTEPSLVIPRVADTRGTRHRRRGRGQ